MTREPPFTRACTHTRTCLLVNVPILPPRRGGACSLSRYIRNVWVTATRLTHPVLQETVGENMKMACGLTFVSKGPALDQGRREPYGHTDERGPPFMQRPGGQRAPGWPSSTRRQALITGVEGVTGEVKTVWKEREKHPRRSKAAHLMKVPSPAIL